MNKRRVHLCCLDGSSTGVSRRLWLYPSVSPVMAQQHALTVSAAISLNAMQEIKISTSAAIGTSTLPTTLALPAPYSNKLNREPVDVFFSAATKQMDALQQRTCCPRLGETC